MQIEIEYCCKLRNGDALQKKLALFAKTNWRKVFRLKSVLESEMNPRFSSSKTHNLGTKLAKKCFQNCKFISYYVLSRKKFLRMQIIFLKYVLFYFHFWRKIWKSSKSYWSINHSCLKSYRTSERFHFQL